MERFFDGGWIDWWWFVKALPQNDTAAAELC
jgi:hypothetical protein